MKYIISDELLTKYCDFQNRTKSYPILNQIEKEEYDEIEKLAMAIFIRTADECNALSIRAKFLQNKLCLGGLWRYTYICTAQIMYTLLQEESYPILE